MTHYQIPFLVDLTPTQLWAALLSVTCSAPLCTLQTNLPQLQCSSEHTPCEATRTHTSQLQQLNFDTHQRHIWKTNTLLSCLWPPFILLGKFSPPPEGEIKMKYPDHTLQTHKFRGNSGVGDFPITSITHTGTHTHMIAREAEHYQQWKNTDRAQVIDGGNQRCGCLLHIDD